MNIDSYYDLLGVANDASADDIRRAFRLAAKRVHPDARPGPTEAMVAVNVAYETLKHPDRRAAYDRTLDVYDDEYVDLFDHAVMGAAAALDEAYSGLTAARWPVPLGAALTLYRQGVQQVEDALEDYFRYSREYDTDDLVEGRELLRGAVEVMAQARRAVASA